jgi:hypothetical protein
MFLSHKARVIMFNVKAFSFELFGRSLSYRLPPVSLIRCLVYGNFHFITMALVIFIRKVFCQSLSVMQQNQGLIPMK